MTPQEFAQKIRIKYPDAYNNIDDVTLSRKVIEKYPVYASQVNFEQPPTVASQQLQKPSSLFERIGKVYSEYVPETIKNIKAGAEEFEEAGKLAGTGKIQDLAKSLIPTFKGIFKSGVRPAADFLITTLAPLSESIGIGLEKSGIGQIINETGEVIADKSGITDMPAFQKWAMEHPEAEKDFERILTLGLFGLTKGGREALRTEIKPIKMAKVTAEKAIETGRIAIETAKEKIGNITEIIKGKATNIFAEPIPEQVKTALKETSGKTFDTYSRIAQKASESFKNKTPLEFAGERAQEALDTMQRKLNNIGKSKSEILNQSKVGNKPVGNIVVKFRQQLNNYLKGKTTIEGDTKLFRDIVSEAKNLGDNPTAIKVDKFIDFIQERIYSGKRDLTIPITEQGEGFLRSVTGQLNNNLKNKLPESYKNLNSQYADLVNIRNELNVKLGFEGEKGGSLMKRIFSPSDARTKKLFADVKTITGIDLVDEATIARFVMEAIGDSRQANVLQQLQLPNLSPKGMLNLLRDVIDRKINTPEQILQRARELTTESQLREANIGVEVFVKNVSLQLRNANRSDLAKIIENANFSGIKTFNGLVEKIRNLIGNKISGSAIESAVTNWLNQAKQFF